MALSFTMGMTAPQRLDNKGQQHLEKLGQFLNGISSKTLNLRYLEEWSSILIERE